MVKTYLIMICTVARQIDKAKDSDIADAAADASDKEKNLTGALLECS